MPVAHGGLCHLGEQGLRVAQQDVQHLAVPLELLLESYARQTVCGTGALHDCAVGGGFASHEQRDTDRAVVPHDGDFRGRAVFHHVQERDDGVGRKIDVAQDIAGLVQHHAKGHRYELQVREQPFAHLLRQRVQNVILLGVSSARHRGSVRWQTKRCRHHSRPLWVHTYPSMQSADTPGEYGCACCVWAGRG